MGDTPDRPPSRLVSAIYRHGLDEGGKIATYRARDLRALERIIDAADELGLDFEALRYRGDDGTEYRITLGLGLTPDVDPFSDEVEPA